MTKRILEMIKEDYIREVQRHYIFEGIISGNDYWYYEKEQAIGTYRKGAIITTSVFRQYRSIGNCLDNIQKGYAHFLKFMHITPLQKKVTSFTKSRRKLYLPINDKVTQLVLSQLSKTAINKLIKDIYFGEECYVFVVDSINVIGSIYHKHENIFNDPHLLTLEEVSKSIDSDLRIIYQNKDTNYNNITVSESNYWGKIKSILSNLKDPLDDLNNKRDELAFTYKDEELDLTFIHADKIYIDEHLTLLYREHSLDDIGLDYRRFSVLNVNNKLNALNYVVYQNRPLNIEFISLSDLITYTLYKDCERINIDD